MNEQITYRDPVRRDLPSASSMEITVSCPGSVALKAKLPPEAFNQKPQEEDEWADKGTRIHRARETGNTLELDQEETDIYQQGLKYENQIVQQWMRDKGLDTCEEGPREMRVWLLDPLNFPEPLGSVQLDVHYYNKSKGAVLTVDWKSGFNPNLPPSPRSWQLRFGAVALHREEYMEWMKGCRVAHCKAQHKCTAQDVCDYTEADLTYSWNSIALHLWEAAQPDAPRHAGRWCNWCPCKAYCPEAGAYSIMPVVMAKQVPNAALVPWENMVAAMAGPDLAKVWELSPIVEKIIKAVKARLKGMSAEELAAIGLMLPEHGRRLDYVTDMPGAFKAMTDQFMLEDVVKAMSIKKTALAEVVMKEKGVNKADAEKWIDNALDPFITRGFAEPSLRRIAG